MAAILRISASVLTILGAAAIWHGDKENAILLLVIAIACRQGAAEGQPR